MLLSLNQHSDSANGDDDYLDDAAESNLRMDDFMWMKLIHKIDDSP